MPERRRTLSTGRVVFLVIAAAAPMAAMVGNVPLALIRGNGAGLPAAYLIGAVVLLCFAVGYAAMSRRVVNTGAFYTYIARALGKPVGVSAAYVAVLAYSSLTIGLVGAFGYFFQLVLADSDVNIAWWVGSVIAILFAGILGYRSVDLSAKVLGSLMVLEFAVLLVFDVFAVAHHGGSSFPSTSFSPHRVFTGAVGISLMFAFTSYVGFESAALYGEETRDPERSVPRATYISLALISVFYLVTSWIIVGAAGGAGAKAMASREEGDLVFTLIQDNAGTWLYDGAAVLFCTSVLASLLAVHNASARYLFALGRERVLPSRLGDYHPDHLSPHIASIAVTAATVLVTLVYAVSDADPYTTFAASLVGLGTLGIIALQAAAALAVVAFFRDRPDRDLWRCFTAPLIGFVGLTMALILALTHYGTLTDSDEPLVTTLPILLGVAALSGLVVALRLRRDKPAIYSRIAASRLRAHRGDTVARAHVDYTRRYCLVGAGPSGIIMARALLAEGVPFDWFERHDDVGGIWDPDNPGSPMYDSAHFISSRYTSGFYGEPMSADLPDYPTWRQVRDYVRGVAATYGLYDHVTLGTAVTSAEPIDGDRWAVTLSTGQTREYDGVIAAPGTNWHANQPELRGVEDFRGEVRHSSTYRSPREFAGRRVVVVGAGNSGVDIACDAARNADAAYLSVRRGYRFVPKHLFGYPTDALLLGYLDPPRGVSMSGDPNKLIDALVGDLTRFGLPAPDHDLLESHPILNSQVLHHLAHGDLIAKSDVDHLTADGVVFTDGSQVGADLVILATGYQYLLPFLDPSLLTWERGHPQLYLHIFSRELDSLYVLGFIELADAAYKRLDEMAQLVVLDIRARETGEHRDAMRELKAHDRPDLRGGMAYVDSPRHTNYVESATYQEYLASLRDRFDWPDVTDTTYSALRVPLAGGRRQSESSRH